MSDPLGAMVAALLADAPTAAIAGTDVFGGELSPDVLARMPTSAILLVPSGGVSLTGGSSAEVDGQRLDLFAFAGTPGDANRLRATAARRLQMIEREVFAGTLIHWVNRAGGFALARDRDGQWPQAFQSFQVFYSFKEIE